MLCAAPLYVGVLSSFVHPYQYKHMIVSTQLQSRSLPRRHPHPHPRLAVSVVPCLILSCLFLSYLVLSLLASSFRPLVLSSLHVCCTPASALLSARGSRAQAAQGLGLALEGGLGLGHRPRKGEGQGVSRCLSCLVKFLLVILWLLLVTAPMMSCCAHLNISSLFVRPGGRWFDSLIV